MQVTLQPIKLNNTQYNKREYNPTFNGLGKSAINTGEVVVKSKLFDPVKKHYDKLSDWIAKNYYERFYRSKFAHWFVDKTKNVKNMTTHMSAVGATLISGMYAIRTLQNDKLDSQKRKTLALNDVMTWGISTAGSYLIDSKLANWWDGVTTRFAANYMLDNPKAKRMGTFGNWNPKNINHFMEKWYIAKNRKIDLFNRKIAASLENDSYKGARKPNLKHIKLEDAIPYKNIRDFNLDVLKNKRLTTLIDGMGVLKSLFVFGMVYRYIVPVLVMKPANKIGAYMHKKKEQEQAQAAKKA